MDNRVRETTCQIGGLTAWETKKMGYDWRKPGTKPLPDIQDFLDMLSKSQEYLGSIDDTGSYHFELSRWKDYFIDMKEILTPEGSL